MLPTKPSAALYRTQTEKLRRLFACAAAYLFDIQLFYIRYTAAILS